MCARGGQRGTKFDQRNVRCSIDSAGSNVDGAPSIKMEFDLAPRSDPTNTPPGRSPLAESSPPTRQRRGAGRCPRTRRPPRRRRRTPEWTSRVDAAATTWIVRLAPRRFYAAVEIRDRPELANKPVAVGGIGMITTARRGAKVETGSRRRRRLRRGSCWLRRRRTTSPENWACVLPCLAFVAASPLLMQSLEYFPPHA